MDWIGLDWIERLWTCLSGEDDGSHTRIVAGSSKGSLELTHSLWAEGISSLWTVDGYLSGGGRGGSAEQVAGHSHARQPVLCLS